MSNNHVSCGKDCPRYTPNHFGDCCVDVVSCAIDRTKPKELVETATEPALVTVSVSSPAPGEYKITSDDVEGKPAQESIPKGFVCSFCRCGILGTAKYRTTAMEPVCSGCFSSDDYVEIPPETKLTPPPRCHWAEARPIEGVEKVDCAELMRWTGSWDPSAKMGEQIEVEQARITKQVQRMLREIPVCGATGHPVTVAFFSTGEDKNYTRVAHLWCPACWAGEE